MEYTAQLHWDSKNAAFAPKTYDRTHQVQFPGGLSIDASSAPEFLGNASLPNPEELFIAAINSCFMLTFLYWAAMKQMPIEQYEAKATGTLAKNAEGKMAVTEIIIQPVIQFQAGYTLDSTLLTELYHKAHDQCFISNSVKTQVKIV